MSAYDWVQIGLFILLLVGATPLLGSYIFKVFQGEAPLLHHGFGWLERLTYRLGGVDPKVEMSWKEYLKALLYFNLIGFLAVFLVQVTQSYLPLNPQNLPNVPWASAFNTASSFVTNTNWQGYAGETTLSYLTQMLGLTVQNFLSAATGFAALLVLIRGFTLKTSATVGNFWADLVRGLVYIFLPLSIFLAIVLVSQGVIQTFSSYVDVTTLENGKQSIPLGPVASQEAIKMLGTNGGGFFNANSAHPFENPTPLSNLLETLAILVIPAATIYAFGLMIGSKRHAWLLYLVVFIFYIGGLGLSLYSEHLQNPILGSNPVLEGIETRFGIGNSVLWSVTTTGTSNGSVNTMIESLSPLSGGISMFNIMLGELIFGGVGVGLASLIMYVILTVFLCGLMVGRTPEYLGKKIEKREIQLAMISILTPGSVILIGAGLSSVNPEALSSLANQGPHGLSSILYAFTSAAGNNGSSFAGLNANTNYYNLALGAVMLITRLAIIVPSIALGGFLAQKKISPPSVGTFATDNFLFVALLISVIFIEGALVFFPALSLGPIVEHFLMLRGQSF